MLMNAKKHFTHGLVIYDIDIAMIITDENAQHLE